MRTRPFGFFGAIMALAFAPSTNLRTQAPIRQPEPPTPQPPVPTQQRPADTYADRRSLASRIGTAECQTEVVELLTEAKRVHAHNPKALHKCRKKASARLDYLLSPL